MQNQCKKCGKEMKLRKGGYGEFWGCTGYPECKHTEQVKIDPRPDGWSKTGESLKDTLAVEDKGLKKDIMIDFLTDISAKLDKVIEMLGSELGGE